MSETTCALCDGAISLQPVSFVESGRLWNVAVQICKNPACLTAHGATSVEHRAEKRLR
jgi:hypothetical protein